MMVKLTWFLLGALFAVWVFGLVLVVSDWRQHRRARVRARQGSFSNFAKNTREADRRAGVECSVTGGLLQRTAASSPNKKLH